MLDALLQKLPGVWRAESLARMDRGLLPSGHAALDKALGGGWPTPALIELLCDQEGIGELQLLLPLLASQAKSVQDVHRAHIALWLNPPHALHAVALAQYGFDPKQHWIADELSVRDTLWAMEQALRSGACRIVVAWAAQANMASLRRLKLAASVGRCLGVLFRPALEFKLPSPATVRVALDAQDGCLQLCLLKVPGRLPSAVAIDVSDLCGVDLEPTQRFRET